MTPFVRDFKFFIPLCYHLVMITHSAKIICFVAAILCFPAFAADQGNVILKVYHGTHSLALIKVPVIGKRIEYEMVLGEKIVAIDFKTIQAQLPLSIEKRSFTNWAVGDEGPWLDLEAIEKATKWEKMPVSHSSDLKIPDDEMTEPETMSPELYSIAYKNLEKSSDKDRWLPLLKQCKKGNKIASPCYSYRSADEFRFTYPDKSEITLRINYPGGC